MARSFAHSLLKALFFLAVAGMLLISLSPASGQAIDTGWTVPVKIGQQTLFPGNPYPKIVAGLDDQIHAFWIDQITPDSNLIMYTRLSAAGGWSHPVNVVVPPSDRATMLFAGVDSYGNLHLAWRDVYGAIYHSYADPVHADNPQGWLVPKEVPADHITEGFCLKVIGENLYIVYIDRQDQSPYFMSSQDSGLTWTKPVLISAFALGDPQKEYASSTADLAIDVDGHIHAVWARGNTQWAYYAQSLDGGVTWEKSMRLPAPDDAPVVYQLSPQVITLGKDIIHITWLGAYEYLANGTLPAKFRFHSWSRDGGLTWTPWEVFFPGVQGHNGPNNMALDSNGALHVTTIGGYGPGAVHWVEYSVWESKAWNDFTMIPDSSRADWGANGPSASHMTISHGNQLHMLWETRDGDMWYSTLRLSAPYVAYDVRPRPTQQPTAIVTLDASATNQGGTLTPNAPLGDYQAPPTNTSNLAILAGIIPVVLFVIAAVLWGRRR